MNGITFNDVSFKPQYSDITHRSSIDLTSDMGGFHLGLPVISANMPDITEWKMAAAMASSGGMGIIHRFMSIEEAVDQYKNAKLELNRMGLQTYNVGVSIGVQDEDWERFETLYDTGARIFCIDIAHGHHVLMKDMLELIRDEYGHDCEGDTSPILIAGNIATFDGAFDLIEWGANIIKVGIGPGSVCETRRNTGVGYPQLQALKDIRERLPKAKIIADGGIKNTGDVAKALLYADAIMTGSLLSGTSETPGDVYEDAEGGFYKMFGGSASGENKVNHGKENQFVEGHRKKVPFRGHVKFILRRIKQNTQSSFSYSGARSLSEFKLKAEFVELGSGAKKESKYE